MPNQQIFCNIPWYELHIYWDGSFGVCAAESHKAYQPNDNQYNIARMSIAEWFNSEPIKKFRQDILTDHPLTACQKCYVEEQNGGNSRRIKGLQKSVIFARAAFKQSFEQSPNQKYFLSSGQTETLPLELHIDLGNYCNLACKMCSASASSTIASQEVKWGIPSSRQYLGTDWTRNTTVWEGFKHQLLGIKNLKNIHLMGGETLLTDRFENLVDFMIEHQRFDLCFSFVTNGTIMRSRLMEKLKLFSRVGIEVSIECLDDHNSYQRQGTDTPLVLENIKKYQEWCNDTTITVTLRPVPSILTIGYYPQLLQYALDNQLVIKSNICSDPEFLYAGILPDNIKKSYLAQYHALLDQLENVNSNVDYNASNHYNCRQIVKEQIQMCITLLEAPAPHNSENLLKEFVAHCCKWDKVYGYDARTHYPEFSNIFLKYGY